MSTSAFPTVTIKRINQHAEHVLIDGIRRYVLRTIRGIDDKTWTVIQDNKRRDWHCPNRNQAIATILWWHWSGGLFNG